MHRAIWRSKSATEQGTVPAKWKMNVSTDEWSCPTRKKLFAFSICKAVFGRGWQILSVCTHVSNYPNQYLENFPSLSLPYLTKLCLFLDFYFLQSCCFWFLVNELCGQENFFTATEKENICLVWYIYCLLFFPSFKLGVSVPTPSLLTQWLNTVHEVEICLLALWNFPLQFTLENVGV